MNLLTIQNTVITDSVVNKNDIKIEDLNIDVTEKTLSIIDLITSGGLGGNLVMGTLAILSIFAIYILIERYSTINKASKEDESFLKSIQNFVEAKDIAAAKTLCKNTNSPIVIIIIVRLFIIIYKHKLFKQ